MQIASMSCLRGQQFALGSIWTQQAFAPMARSCWPGPSTPFALDHSLCAIAVATYANCKYNAMQKHTVPRLAPGAGVMVALQGSLHDLGDLCEQHAAS